jgi:seryl-tRNA synthetase
MLDIKLIRENPQKVKEACEKKHIQCDIDALLELDTQKRADLTAIEALKAQKNKLGKDNIEEAKQIKEKIKSLEPKLQETEKKLIELLRKLPNIPFDDVPVGKDDSENIVLRQEGKLPKFDFTPKEHFELGETLGIIDIERASKIAGSRFYFLKNEAALLEIALANFVFAKLVKKGFSPVIPPVMLKPELAAAMGYIENPEDEKGDEEGYYLERDRLYLTATSEQTLGAMHADEVLDLQKAKKYVALSTCFRRESGSYGKDTKGIFRVHQFDKMEMFIFCKPEESEQYHKELLAIEEELMKDLQIPYRVINICTGDLGKPAARKYDIEAWMPGQNRYRETHSTSNCTDFQARGLNTRYKNNQGELEFVHTLNGTGFALGRIIVAILENYQQKDGSVKVPKALHKYTGFKVIKPKV